MPISLVRRADLVARYGGDEFVLILPGTDFKQAGVVADRIRGSLAHWSQQQGVALSVSIGIAEAPRHGEDLTSVLKYVDGAMYQRKQVRRQGTLGRVRQRDELYSTKVEGAGEI